MKNHEKIMKTMKNHENHEKNRKFPKNFRKNLKNDEKPKLFKKSKIFRILFGKFQKCAAT